MTEHTLQEIEERISIYKKYFKNAESDWLVTDVITDVENLISEVRLLHFYKECIEIEALNDLKKCS